MTTIRHTTAGRKLNQAEYESALAHTIGDSTTFYLGALGATAWVIANDAPTAIKNFANMLSQGGYPVFLCDGTADNVQIQAALDAAGSLGTVVGSAGGYYLVNTVNLDAPTSGYHRQALLFMPGARVYNAADVDLFHLTRDTILSGPIIYTNGLNFTKTVITLDYSSCRVEHIQMRGDEGAGSGTAIKISTNTTHGTYYNLFDDLKITGYEYGIYNHSNGSGGSVLNHFTRLRGAKCTNFIYEYAESGSIHGNIYEFVYQEGADEVAVIHCEGSRSRYIGSIYDYAPATAISVAGYGNYFQINGTTTYYHKFSDSGRNNTYFDEYAGVLHTNIASKVRHSTSDLNMNEVGDYNTHTNLGATGAVTLKLPDKDYIGEGILYIFLVMANEELRIDPDSNSAIYLDGVKLSDGEYIVADAVGESIKLMALRDDSGNIDWWAYDKVGTWTEESP